MLHLESLPSSTRSLFGEISTIKEISEFTLIGGTALSLNWGHRISEDLDFSIPRLNLPKSICNKIINKIRKSGWDVIGILSHEDIENFENEGGDLHANQQDYLCRNEDNQNGVKLTFYAEYSPLLKPSYEVDRINFGNINIMRPDNLFTLKSNLLLKRRAVRDLFDISEFMKRGRSLEEVIAEIRKVDQYVTWDRIKYELLYSKATIPSQTIETPSGEIITLQEVRARLETFVASHEIAMSAKMLLNDDSPNQP